MEAVRSSEMLVSYCNTLLHHNLEDFDLNLYHHENLKSSHTSQEAASLSATTSQEIPHLFSFITVFTRACHLPLRIKSDFPAYFQNIHSDIITSSVLRFSSPQVS